MPAVGLRGARRDPLRAAAGPAPRRLRQRAAPDACRAPSMAWTWARRPGRPCSTPTTTAWPTSWAPESPGAGRGPSTFTPRNDGGPARWGSAVGTLGARGGRSRTALQPRRHPCAESRARLPRRPPAPRRSCRARLTAMAPSAGQARSRSGADDGPSPGRCRPPRRLRARRWGEAAPDREGAAKGLGGAGRPGRRVERNHAPLPLAGDPGGGADGGSVACPRRA
jgi:hypothetical protein